MSCLICNKDSEKHHLKSVGSGGTDEPHNIMNLCRLHHQEFHRIGFTTFANKYVVVKIWLTNRDWYFVDSANKWRHE